MQPHLQQPISVAMAYRPIFQHGMFRPVHLMVMTVTLVLALVTSYPSLQPALRLLWRAAYNSSVRLLHVMALEHLVQPRQGL